MKISTFELSNKIFERYETQHTIESYFGLLTYYALAQTADAEKIML